MNDYAYVGGKPLSQFLTETSRTAVAKLNRPDLFEDVYQELWVFALSRPDLIDKETIRNHHATNAIFDPWYRVDDPEVNYSAAKVLKLEGQRIAQQLNGEHIERPTEVTYTGKDVAKLLKDWDAMPEALRMALASDRLPEAWRTALEQHYRDGKKAATVGKMTLVRARDRVVEIINSGTSNGQDASPEAVAQEGWGPQLREAGFKAARYTEEASESDSEDLEDGTTSEPSTGLYGALSGVSDVNETSTDEQIAGYLCGPSPMRARTPAEQKAWLRKYWDVEYDLFVWGRTGRYTSVALEFLIAELPEEEREALHVRYADVDGKRKRELEHEGIYVLNKIRMSMGSGVGKGLAKK